MAYRADILNNIFSQNCLILKRIKRLELHYYSLCRLLNSSIAVGCQELAVNFNTVQDLSNRDEFYHHEFAAKNLKTPDSFCKTTNSNSNINSYSTKKRLGEAANSSCYAQDYGYIHQRSNVLNIESKYKFEYVNISKLKPANPFTRIKNINDNSTKSMFSTVNNNVSYKDLKDSHIINDELKTKNYKDKIKISKYAKNVKANNIKNLNLPKENYNFYDFRGIDTGCCVRLGDEAGGKINVVKW